MLAAVTVMVVCHRLSELAGAALVVTVAVSPWLVPDVIVPRLSLSLFAWSGARVSVAQQLNERARRDALMSKVGVVSLVMLSVLLHPYRWSPAGRSIGRRRLELLLVAPMSVLSPGGALTVS